MEQFSELIKRRRLEKGLTMRGLEGELKRAGANNISRSLINLIEKSARRPSYEVAYNLAIALDIDIRTALKAAFRSRIEHDKGREEAYLREFMEEKELREIKLDEILE